MLNDIVTKLRKYKHQIPLIFVCDIDFTYAIVTHMNLHHYSKSVSHCYFVPALLHSLEIKQK